MRTLVSATLPVAFLLFTLPWWLPRGLGGDNSYNFILTGSMRGTLDPGSFVLLRQADTYKPGDIAGYTLLLEDGQEIIIVHRIMERLPTGVLIFKGDANMSSEIVRAEQLVGKMVLGLPGVGLFAGTIQSFPLVIAAAGAIPLLLLRRKKGASDAGSKEPAARPRRRYLFFAALAAVAIGIPLYSTGLAKTIGHLQVSLAMVFLLIVARVLESRSADASHRSMADMSYGLIITLSVTMVSVTDVITAVRLALSDA